MATADKFSAFAGATPPVAPGAETKPAEKAPEAPPEPPATGETREAPKRRQRAAQPRTGGNTTKADPSPEPPAPEPAPEPEEDATEPERPMLTRAQEAPWELWLQSAAGKARKTREAAEQALDEFMAQVAEAREAGVSEWSIQAAALRGRIDLPE